MQAPSLFCIACALLHARTVTSHEVISDIISENEAIGREALQLKHKQFWTALLSDAEAAHIPEHLRLCEQADAEIAQLPEDRDYVRKTLTEAVERLRSANSALLAQLVQASDLAKQKLAQGPEESTSASSAFFRGGSIADVFQKAVRQFLNVGVGGNGNYAERLHEQVSARQADVVPMLQGAASNFGSIMSECRAVSKAGFDVLKYDIYTRGVPKTPQAAKDLANKLIDAAGKTRQYYTSSIRSSAAAIAADATGKQDGASATLMLSSMPEGSAGEGAAGRANTQLVNV